MTLGKAFLLTLPLLLFAGCATNPTAGFEDVKKTISERTGQTIAWPVSEEESKKADVAISEALRGALTVDSAVRVALLNNRRLRATFEELGISRAELIQAGLLSNPSVGGQIRFPDRPPSAANLEFSLSQDLFDLFLLPLRKRLAGAAFEQAKLKVSSEVLSLIAEVKAAFYTVVAREQFAKRVRLIVGVNEAGADLSARQHQAGNITDLSLANQVDAFQESKLELAKAELELRADRERLNRLLGVWGGNTAWTVLDELPALPEKELPLDGLESFAIEQRLDLALARQQLALAGGVLGLQESTRYLPAGVNIGVGTERDTDRSWVTGPSLEFTLPIFDQGQGAITRLQAQYRQAKWQLEALATDIRSEVREARDSLTSNRDLAEFYGKVVLPQRIRIVNETLLQYNAMQVGAFELISAKERELTAEREYVEASRDYWISRAELEKAVGGRLPSPAPLNQHQH